MITKEDSKFYLGLGSGWETLEFSFKMSKRQTCSTEIWNFKEVSFVVKEISDHQIYSTIPACGILRSRNYHLYLIRVIGELQAQSRKEWSTNAKVGLTILLSISIYIYVFCGYCFSGEQHLIHIVSNTERKKWTELTIGRNTQAAMKRGHVNILLLQIFQTLNRPGLVWGLVLWHGRES